MYIPSVSRERQQADTEKSTSNMFLSIGIGVGAIIIITAICYVIWRQLQVEKNLEDFKRTSERDAISHSDLTEMFKHNNAQMLTHISTHLSRQEVMPVSSTRGTGHASTMIDEGEEKGDDE